MAITSYNTILKWGTSADNVAKVVDIKDFSDLIGDPNLVDTTTLSDPQQVNIPGIRQSNNIQFTCNYDGAIYSTVSADENKELYFELTFGDGSGFTWQGQFTLGVPGKGVDEVDEFTINVVASTALTHKVA